VPAPFLRLYTERHFYYTVSLESGNRKRSVVLTGMFRFKPVKSGTGQLHALFKPVKSGTGQLHALFKPVKSGTGQLHALCLIQLFLFHEKFSPLWLNSP
jgi:hypothetical protein